MSIFMYCLESPSYIMYLLSRDWFSFPFFFFHVILSYFSFLFFYTDNNSELTCFLFTPFMPLFSVCQIPA